MVNCGDLPSRGIGSLPHLPEKEFGSLSLRRSHFAFGTAVTGAAAKAARFAVEAKEAIECLAAIGLLSMTIHQPPGRQIVRPVRILNWLETLTFGTLAKVRGYVR